VASTKAYTTQLAASYALALAIADARQCLSSEERLAHLCHMRDIAALVTEVLANEKRARAFASEMFAARSALFLGRGFHIATAMEGALKLKELAYIHAEGYAAGEMKHGPLALVDSQFFVLFIAPRDRTYEKLVSTAQEIRARDGRVVSQWPAHGRRSARDGLHPALHRGPIGDGHFRQHLGWALYDYSELQ